MVRARAAGRSGALQPWPRQAHIRARLGASSGGLAPRRTGASDADALGCNCAAQHERAVLPVRRGAAAPAVLLRVRRYSRGFQVRVSPPPSLPMPPASPAAALRLSAAGAAQSRGADRRRPDRASVMWRIIRNSFVVPV